jgi:hypothetical protein
MFKKHAVLIPVAAALALAFASVAFAGNGAGSTKSSSSSISAPVVVSLATVSAATATTVPRYGDTITFDVSTTATDQAFVNLVCSQNGVLLLNGWGAFFAADTSVKTFTLTSGAWTGGAADCTANLGMYVSSSKYKVLASSSFHVDA